MKDNGQSSFHSASCSGRVGAIALLVFTFNFRVSLMATEPSDRRAVSQRISDAILADYRCSEQGLPAPSATVPQDVEPGVVLLPNFRVSGERAKVRLKPEDVLVKSRTAPLVLGSGIKELRGRKVTMSTQTLFYVPIGWKIAW